MLICPLINYARRFWDNLQTYILNFNSAFRLRLSSVWVQKLSLVHYSLLKLLTGLARAAFNRPESLSGRTPLKRHLMQPGQRPTIAEGTLGKVLQPMIHCIPGDGKAINAAIPPIIKNLLRVKWGMLLTSAPRTFSYSNFFYPLSDCKSR